MEEFDELWMMISGLPTSVNRMNRQYQGRKVPVKSAEYIEFRDRVWSVLRMNGMPRCRWEAVEVNLYLFPPNRRKIDADNRFKALFDALNPNRKKGWPGYWSDDSIVKKCSACICPPVRGGKTVVRIAPFEEEPGAEVPEDLRGKMTPYHTAEELRKIKRMRKNG